MNPVLMAASTLLHLLATVIMIGLYLLTFFVVTPAATREGNAVAQVGVLVDVYKRAKPAILLAWLVFILTGLYLMLVNDQYEGVGQFTNAWSVVMLAKHVVIVGMIFMSGFINVCPAIGLLRPLEAAVIVKDETQISALIPKLRARERVMMVLALAVVLLTAVAEAA